MALDLSSVRAKLSRATIHAQTVKNEVSALMDRNPYSVLQKVNTDSTRYSIVIRVNEAPAIRRWSLMIADCFFNLRCSLDHLIYAVACHESSPQPPAYEDKLQFPIVDDPTNFQKAVAEQKRLGAISDRVRAAIERYQPYNRPHPNVPPLLSILRDLTNRDKHKLLPLAMHSVATASLGFVGEVTDANERDPRFHHSDSEIEDGAEVCAITFNRPTPDMKFDRTIFNVIVGIRHGKRDPSLPERADRSEFTALLNLLRAEVREIIYEVSGKVV